MYLWEVQDEGYAARAAERTICGLYESCTFHIDSLFGTDDFSRQPSTTGAGCRTVPTMGCRFLLARLATPDLPPTLQDHIEALKAKLLAADARLNELESSNHDLQSRNQVMDSCMHLSLHMEGWTKALCQSQAHMVDCTPHSALLNIQQVG